MNDVTLRHYVGENEENEIVFYTGVGYWKAEVVPGVFVLTKSPSLWKRFWIFIFFGIRGRMIS